MQQVLPVSMRVPLALLVAFLFIIGRPAPLAADSPPLPSQGTSNPTEPQWQKMAKQIKSRSTAAVEQAPQGVNPGSVGAMFDFSSLTPAQTEWATSTVASNCDYDWQKLMTGLAGRKVGVEIATPADRGLFYPAELRIEVHRWYYSNSEKNASRILAWELAHAVDQLAVTPEQRQQIIDLYSQGESDAQQWLTGPYEDQIGEAFMEGFVAAFCKPLAVRSSYFSHETTPAVAAGIRQILL